MWKLLLEATFDNQVKDGTGVGQDRLIIVADTWIGAYDHAKEVAVNNHTQVKVMRRFQRVWLVERDVSNGC